MSKHASPTIIGAFLLTALGLGILALFMFGSGQYFKKKESFALYFKDSINGLDVGASVKFKGVSVGQVSEILIRFNEAKNSAYIPVVVEIDDLVLAKNIKTDLEQEHGNAASDFRIKKGLRAKLIMQSYLTSKLFIELDFYPDAAPPAYVRGRLPHKEIPVIGSDLNEVWSDVTDVLTDLKKINFAGIGDRIESLVTYLDEGIKKVEFERINDELLGTLSEVKKTARNFDVDTLVDKASGAFDKFGATFNSLDKMMKVYSPFRYQLSSTLEEVEDTAKAIRVLVEYLERNPNALIAGKYGKNQSSRR